MTAISQMNEALSSSPDELVVRHGVLVKRIAYHLISRLPPHIEVDDLIQAGMIGLLNAADNYTPDKGANFETYAGIRIRGAILDEARKTDWTPRSVYRNVRRVSDTVRQIENRTGRDANGAEVADAMGLSMAEYHRVLQDSVNCRLLSFQYTEDSENGVGGDIPDTHSQGPLEALEDDGFRDALADAIATLPEREQLVMALYYDEELNLREIGEVIEVSESRVCQIHGQALVRIRARMGRWIA